MFLRDGGYPEPTSHAEMAKMAAELVDQAVVPRKAAHGSGNLRRISLDAVFFLQKNLTGQVCMSMHALV